MEQWIKEFGIHYHVPIEVNTLIGNGILDDISWHNDTAPSFTHVNDEAQEECTFPRLWVEHLNPAERECQKEDSQRFAVQNWDGHVHLETNDINVAIISLLSFPRQVPEWKKNSEG